MQKHYRLRNAYVGSFDGVEPPDGAIECPAPPHGDAEWVGNAWAYNGPSVVRIEAMKDALIARFDQPTSIDKVLFKISFLQENRIRALEGKQPITAQQFKDWVRGQID